MKTKPCATCKQEHTTMYRVQFQKVKLWVFVCEACCIKAKSNPQYRYGGTWKGYRH